jgi:hypothetical protein
MNKVTNVDIIKVAGGGHNVLKVVKKDRKFNKKDKNKESTDSDQKTRNPRGQEEVYIFGTKI